MEPTEQAILHMIVLGITLFGMAIGLISTALPPLPGTAIMWVMAAFYGLMLGWREYMGWPTFILLTFFMLVGIAGDLIAGHFGARFGGASWQAILIGVLLGLALGIISSLIGTPIFGCFAGAIGMIAAILWIEWHRNKDLRRAMRAAQGYVVGAVAGIMAKVTSGVIMFAIFLIRVALAF